MYRVNNHMDPSIIVFVLQITIEKYQYLLVETTIYENIVIEYYVLFKYGCANCIQ